ncbi:MAG: DMT family transporter [Bacteroidota bacterium]
MTAQTRSIVSLLIGAFLISFTSVFVKLAEVGPTTSAFYRVFLGGAILLVYGIIRKHRIWAGKAALMLSLGGGVIFSIDLFLWHRSILYIGPGLATILGNFQVFFLALVGVLYYKEYAGWKLWTSIPVAVAGLFLIVSDQWFAAGPGYRIGIWLGLGTALAYTMYILFIRNAQRLDVKLSSEMNLAYVSLISAACLGLLVGLDPSESFSVPNLETWGSLIGLALVGQVLGWVIISNALPNLETSVSGLILLLQPALAFIWDILLFDRPSGWMDLTGALIALAAIYLGATARKK